MIFFALLVIFNARFDKILSNSERNVLKSLFGKKRKKCVVDRHSLSMSNDLLFEKVDSQKKKTSHNVFCRLWQSTKQKHYQISQKYFF